VVYDKLNCKRGFTGTKGTDMHTILARGNHNAGKNLVQRHVKPETMKKLPKVILT
jgi:hypothetical protein